MTAAVTRRTFITAAAAGVLGLLTTGAHRRRHHYGSYLKGYH